MEADEAASGSATATPSPAEQACLAAVSRETNNGDVTLLASETAESGTFITIGVGEDRAPWQCAVDGDGNVWNVEYMGMNG